MDNNIKIARALIRLAKSLVADDGNGYNVTYWHYDENRNNAESKNFASMQEVEKFVRDIIEDEILTNNYYYGFLEKGNGEEENAIKGTQEEALKDIREKGHYYYSDHENKGTYGTWNIEVEKC